MANDSNASSSMRYRFSDDLIRSITTLVVFDSIFTVVGILINAWLLASILTSITLRSRLRNQLICCIASLHIIEDLVVGVFNIVARYLNFLYRWRLWMSLNCQTYHYMSTMNVAVNAAGDAMIVVLACVFLAQVLDFDPASKLSSRRLKIGKIALVLFPLGSCLGRRTSNIGRDQPLEEFKVYACQMERVLHRGVCVYCHAALCRCCRHRCSRAVSLHQVWSRQHHSTGPTWASI